MKAFNQMPSICFPADVVEVDADSLTCTVSPINGAELFNVRLKASVNGVTDGVVEIPAIDSSVLVCLIGNSMDQAFVAKVDQVEKVVIFGGENGGLTITPKLVQELNKTNALIQSLLSVINGAPVPEPGSGAPSALQSSLKGAITGKQLGDYSAIENEKVVH